MFACDRDQQILLRSVQFVLHPKGTATARGPAAERFQVVLVLPAQELHLGDGDTSMPGAESSLQAEARAED